MTLAWVVGSGGLLGSALADRAHRRGALLFDANPVRWADDSASATLAADAARFAYAAGERPWALVWAAGSSVVASSDAETNPELDSLSALLDALVANRPAGPGTVFLTSSAGGVYAGSSHPPFGVHTEPVAISAYGALKLKQERVATQLLAGRIPLVIGRFANLYGPDQKPEKAQGLVSQLCWATARRQSLNLYVSMDTVRDYLYVDDGAAIAWAAVEQSLAEPSDQPRTIVIGSGRPTTVAEVIATVQSVTRRRVPLAIGTDPSAPLQAVDLRLIPTSVGDEDFIQTPLPTGVRRVFDAIVGRTK